MANREYLLRLELIIQKLKKKPASFLEIQDFLEYQSELLGYDLVVSKRTFQRDLRDIFSIYEIIIEYDRYLKAYALREELTSRQDRLLESLDLFHALNIMDKHADYIHFETRQAAGTEFLHEILYAIQARRSVQFLYSKFWTDEITTRRGDPLAIKEYKNRWYLLLKEENKMIKLFSLDRMSEWQIQPHSFVYPHDFDVQEYYRHSFGIMAPNAPEPQEVILSFLGFQGKYIISLPLHSSQEVIKEGADEIQVRLKIFITHDFEMELLSYGDQVKVIKPKSLADKMRKIHERAALL